MDEDAWRAAVHEGDVDDGGVVVARVLLGAEDGGKGRETPVRFSVAASIAPIHHPFKEGR